MTKQELTKLLENIPDDAVIYIEADHEQQPEQTGGVRVTKDAYLPYYGDDMNWNEELDPKEVTAVLIW